MYSSFLANQDHKMGTKSSVYMTSYYWDGIVELNKATLVSSCVEKLQ